jgi:hypothetical protein
MWRCADDAGSTFIPHTGSILPEDCAGCMILNALQ